RAPHDAHSQLSRSTAARYRRRTSYDAQNGQLRCKAPIFACRRAPLGVEGPPARFRPALSRLLVRRARSADWPMPPREMGCGSPPAIRTSTSGLSTFIPMVKYEKRGHIGILTIDRPEARNAVNGEVAEAMEAAIDDLEGDDEVWIG